MSKLLRLSRVVIAAIYLTVPVAYAERDHTESSAQSRHIDHKEHEEGAISLTKQQLLAAGIVVKPIKMTKINAVFNAPGVVSFNNYKTTSITPRINAQLITRHVALGNRVKQGQAIATLSSVAMAEAQGNLLLAHKEWVRAKQLGKKIISDKRFTLIRAEWQLAQAKVKAYGMTEQQISHFIKTEDFSQADGHFDLIAMSDGTIVKEAFVKGEQIEPGQEINLITDESSLWVLANVPPSLTRHISLDSVTSVIVNNQHYPAKVAQISHSLDEITRTHIIRLEVDNTHDELHSGLFVDTQIEVSTGKKARGLSLPVEAIVRNAEGDWQVMVEQDHIGEFKGVKVNVKSVINEIAVIEGLDEGTRVVTEGAFFVQSELAKNNFEVHNH